MFQGFKDEKDCCGKKWVSTVTRYSRRSFSTTHSIFMRLISFQPSLSPTLTTTTTITKQPDVRMVIVCSPNGTKCSHMRLSVPVSFFFFPCESYFPPPFSFYFFLLNNNPQIPWWSKFKLVEKTALINQSSTWAKSSLDSLRCYERL